jgi:hypothetical protein
MGADIGGLPVMVHVGGSWFAPRFIQQLSRDSEAGGSAAVGKQPVMTNAVEASGQHMQQEAAHELAGLERHGLVAGVALGTVVLPAKGHAALVTSSP